MNATEMVALLDNTATANDLCRMCTAPRDGSLIDVWFFAEPLEAEGTVTFNIERMVDCFYIPNHGGRPVWAQQVWRGSGHNLHTALKVIERVPVGWKRSTKVKGITVPAMEDDALHILMQLIRQHQLEVGEFVVVSDYRSPYDKL